MRRLRPLCTALGVSLLGYAVFACTAGAATFHRDTTPLPSDVTSGATSTASTHAASSGSSAALRMFLGLAIVLAVIFGLYRLLKRASKRTGTAGSRGDGISLVASTPLGPQQQAVHLLQVGEELVLVGAAANGVTPIRVYSADEARRLFGVDPLTALPAPVAAAAAGNRSGGSFLPAVVEELRRRTAR